MEAVDSGIKFIVSPVERVPSTTSSKWSPIPNSMGVRLLGPGSIGIISPGIAAAGWLGGTPEFARKVFVPGTGGRHVEKRRPIGHRALGHQAGRAGHEHGGPRRDRARDRNVLRLIFCPFSRKDPETKGVAVFGEIGGPHEEEAAECVRSGAFTKPLVIFVAGAWAPEGMRFSHASSIIERGKGSAKSKMESLREVGAHVVDRPDQIAPTIKKLIESI